MEACTNCRQESSSDDMREHSQDSTSRLCPDCAISCEDCGDVYCTSDLHTAHEDSPRRNRNPSIRCESCAIQCADCSQWVYGHENTTNASDGAICQQCAENYTCCEDCRVTLHRNDSHYDEHFAAEGGYCQSCYDERETLYTYENGESDDEDTSYNRTRIRVHDYKPTPRFMHSPLEKIGNTPIYAGLEIEVECGGDRLAAIRDSGLADDSAYYVKRDGSLERGFETVSHPGTLAYWQGNKFAWAEKLSKLKCTSYDTTTCGMHVHLSKSALTPAQQTKLLLFVKQNPAFMLFISRRANKSALSRWAAVDDRSTRGLLLKVKGEIATERESRYTLVNVQNEHTIEFRLFRGTLHPAAIKRNIAFCFALAGFIGDTSLTKLSYRDFTAWLVASGRKTLGPIATVALITWCDRFNPRRTVTPLAQAEVA